MSESVKTAAQLKVELDAISKKVQIADAEGRKQEKRLMDEVKKKIKAAAGDMEKLREQKRLAFAAWQRQDDVETAHSEAKRIHAEDAARAQANGVAAASDVKAALVAGAQAAKTAKAAAATPPASTAPAPAPAPAPASSGPASAAAAPASAKAERDADAEHASR
jgi:hypothetical protein